MARAFSMRRRRERFARLGSKQAVSTSGWNPVADAVRQFEAAGLPGTALAEKAAGER